MSLRDRFNEGRRAARDVVALDAVSFKVRSGEAFGIIGRNGAGKSTLMRVLGRTLAPDGGQLSVRGETSTLLQLGVGFNPDLSGAKNIHLGCLAAGLTRSETAELYEDIVSYSELGDAIDRPLRTYSRGMQSRLGFSIGKHLNPDILLLDEVLAVGDEAFREKSLKAMYELLDRSGTIVLVSHGLKVVQRFCDRVMWIDEGKKQKIGAAKEVVNLYRDTLVKPAFDMLGSGSDRRALLDDLETLDGFD